MALEPQVFDAQPQRLGEPQSGSVEQRRDELARAAHGIEHGAHLAFGQHRRQAFWRLRALEQPEGADLFAQDRLVQKDQRIDGLVLRRAGDVPLHGQIREKAADDIGA
jgi:hypothetical protein